ncbi:hypothetical protein CAOG_05615 [Capsaspora owczarzaki ATCC 30864]|uniref:Uncharacterized protein n=1 Tax=Capsaspora owczarzaki (strain ATCC 30864) TaxID=595528 RepID=A0A0D2VUT5_CAPO3|nr:hypothetical protein CAOG_05615 [Capsaspora owczarzaki ATCC 30864]KJE95132.1 hypothetical protein CAOG_005615 [Capsaspora owczarzaki ATCC 30864]|eukprot:XP_004346288.1 hypothetical protein CAOG_05615 [Capsaspora owczarzaki ATCC 30864]
MAINHRSKADFYFDHDHGDDDGAAIAVGAAGAEQDDGRPLSRSSLPPSLLMMQSQSQSQQQQQQPLANLHLQQWATSHQLGDLPSSSPLFPSAIMLNASNAAAASPLLGPTSAAAAAAAAAGGQTRGGGGKPQQQTSGGKQIQPNPEKSVSPSISANELQAGLLIGSDPRARDQNSTAGSVQPSSQSQTAQNTQGASQSQGQGQAYGASQGAPGTLLHPQAQAQGLGGIGDQAEMLRSAAAAAASSSITSAGHEQHHGAARLGRARSQSTGSVVSATSTDSSSSNASAPASSLHLIRQPHDSNSATAVFPASTHPAPRGSNGGNPSLVLPQSSSSSSSSRAAGTVVVVPSHSNSGAAAAGGGGGGGGGNNAVVRPQSPTTPVSPLVPPHFMVNSPLPQLQPHQQPPHLHQQQQQPQSPQHAQAHQQQQQQQQQQPSPPPQPCSPATTVIVGLSELIITDRANARGDIFVLDRNMQKLFTCQTQGFVSPNTPVVSSPESHGPPSARHSADESGIAPPASTTPVSAADATFANIPSVNQRPKPQSTSPTGSLGSDYAMSSGVLVIPSEYRCMQFTIVDTAGDLLLTIRSQRKGGRGRWFRKACISIYREGRLVATIKKRRAMPSFLELLGFGKALQADPAATSPFAIHSANLSAGSHDSDVVDGNDILRLSSPNTGAATSGTGPAGSSSSSSSANGSSARTANFAVDKRIRAHIKLVEERRELGDEALISIARNSTSNNYEFRRCGSGFLSAALLMGGSRKILGKDGFRHTAWIGADNDADIILACMLMIYRGELE